MARVLIADDHALFRAGVRHYLEQDPGIDTIGETGTGAETLEQLRSGNWDLVLLDINMPNGSGVDILHRIRGGHPNTRVLILSAFAESQYAVNMLTAGASGYLVKDQAPEELLRAIRAVLSGKRFVSATLGELLLTMVGEPTDQPLHTGLSQREFQVLRKLAVGRSVSEIADELYISVKTVSTYRARLLEKMRMQTNADLTTYALRNGLIQ